MPRIKVGDRIKAFHPAGHHLLGEVLSIRKRSCEKKARYCEVRFDHSHKNEWVAIELLELNQVRSNTVAGDIEERVIELGKSIVESLIERDIELSSLTHVLPPKPGSSIAVSTIFPASTGWVECKTIKGGNYYYLRSGSSPQRYLGSTWVEAIDRLPRFLDVALKGLPF
jgi:hypothetical protein